VDSCDYGVVRGRLTDSELSEDALSSIPRRVPP